MRYEVGLINPLSNEQRTVFVDMSVDQVVAAHESKDWMAYVQRLARRPHGFLFLGCAIRPVFDA
jgi:hypothetical protein